MKFFILIIVVVLIVSFLLGRKTKDRIVSDSSPFSFADDMLIINTGSSSSVKGSEIDCINLKYNPKALNERFYDMKITILKVDGSSRNIRYRGSCSGTTPQDIAASLKEHNIKCNS